MSKSHLEIFNIFFIFSKQKPYTLGGGEPGGNLSLWEMSQTAIKCVFLSQGDYFTSCGLKTLRGSLVPVPGRLPARQPGPPLPRVPELGLLLPRGEEGPGCTPRPSISPPRSLPSSLLTSPSFF